MAIQILPDDVISKIAAGEVVERPASVVKELIENSLDAGAKNIHIEAVSGGRKRIAISDDGIGILADEVALAITRHATSKLRVAEDLERINTLGFRGEALASVASVSHFTLSTRHRDEQVGTEIRVEGGHIIHEKAIGAPAGTVIRIENLFYNTPARLKFLKSETTEKRHINNIVTNYAMAYPDVRFILMQDGREIFRSTGSGELADVVVKVLGLDTFKDLLEVSGEDRIRESGGIIDVYGYVSRPRLNRNDRTRINLFVNGRAVQDSGLTYAVTQAYHSLLDKGRYPFAVLMLRIPPDFVDVNVHPTKAEVRFQDTNIVFTALQRTVRHSIIGYAQASRHSGYGSMANSNDAWSSPYSEQQLDLDLDVDDYQSKQEMSKTSSDPTAIPDGLRKPQKPRTLPPLRIVGQVGAAYIVAEGPAGMYLIDQYAAHTRVLYQELNDLYAQQESIPQRQLESQTLEMSGADAQIFAKHLDALNAVGFSLESFGSTTYLIRGIPNVLQTGDPTEIVYGLLDTLKVRSNDPLNQRLLIHIAERAAIKSGQILSVEDMRSLVQKLERCPDPHSSPSGQATLIHMTAEHLAREFERGNR